VKAPAQPPLLLGAFAAAVAIPVVAAIATVAAGVAVAAALVVDGGRARIILAALVAPAEVQENQPALDYDAAADVYHCLGGAVLRFLSQSEATLRRIDQAPAAAGTGWALRNLCTTAPRGRRISRSLDEPDLERVRGYHATEPYAKAMRKRQVWVAPLFAEAKQWHGLRRFRWRGLEPVNGEALLIAAGQNRKRLLSRRGWGQRPVPNGAIGIVLPAYSPRPSLAR
jgi:hypothetical protein